MTTGLALFAFLLTLILVSIGPIGDWRLSRSAPLDDDDLPWAAVGYGSAAVSLNCLFGAYAAALLLVGLACFAGVVAGVVAALFTINWRLAQVSPRTGFQTLLREMRFSDSLLVDHLLWLLLVFCQLGLALSELILLTHMLATGLQLPRHQAIVGALAVACVGYYYCLFGGYRAVFRTDLLQFILILLMGASMLFVAIRLGIADGFDMSALRDLGRHSFLVDHPLLRTCLEWVAGLALGSMPVLAAPDAWKRVLIVRRRASGTTANGSQAPPEMISARLRAWIKSLLANAPIKLTLAASLPLLLIAPLLLIIASAGKARDWTFPLETIFALSPDKLDPLIALGMVAAFLSTFDGALISAVHLLLLQRAFKSPLIDQELHRFRVLLGLAFSVVILLLVPLFSNLPNPYALGACLVSPFGLAAGILLGSGFGRRVLRGKAVAYFGTISLAAWTFFCVSLASDPGASENPYRTAPLVIIGCLVFLLSGSLSRIYSRRVLPEAHQ